MDIINKKDLDHWNKSIITPWMLNDWKIVNYVAKKFMLAGYDYKTRKEKIMYINMRNQAVRRSYKLVIIGYGKKSVSRVNIPNVIESIIFKYTENVNNYVGINEYNLRFYQARMHHHYREWLEDK